MQDNNPVANTAANAAYATANPGFFGGSGTINTGGSSGGNQSVIPANSVSDSASGANPTALAAGVKSGNVTGSLDAQGNYVPPSTTQEQLLATGTVSGQTPSTIPGSSNGIATSATSTGLQMPTGDAANTQYDPLTGKEENPSKAAFDQMKTSGTAAPQDSASGVSGANTATTAATTPPAPVVPAAVQSFMQSDTVKQQAAALMEQFSPIATTTELNNQIATVNTDKTILSGLNTQLMNIKTVMAGTQDDLRSEITAAGGFATESQIDALAVGRNKTLLTQATQLTDQIATQNQTVANDVSLLTDEKDMAATAFNEQSSVYKMAQDNYNNSLNAAKDSLNSVISAVGYNGLFQSLMQTGGAQAVNHAEQVLELSAGQLQGLGIAQSNALGQKTVNDLMNSYVDAGIQPTDSLQVAQAKALKSPTYQLKIAADKANINQSNASAGSSAASAAKTKADLAFEQANGGMTPTEVQASQKDQNTQEHTFNTNAANLIGQMTTKTIDWNTAWNQLHAQYPNLSTNTIDNALNAAQYRSKYGG